MSDRNLDPIGTVYVTPAGDIYRLDEAGVNDLMEEWREHYHVMIAGRGFTNAYALPHDAKEVWRPEVDNSHLVVAEGTTHERLRYLRATNFRLRKFLSRAASLYWRIEPSGAAADCVIVRHPRLDDHFVIYVHGSGQSSSLAIYDGRTGNEFTQIREWEARHALTAMQEMP